jgi:chromosomal replication initiator protein
MPDARQLWQTALGELQLLMTRANYETWLANSQGLGFDGEVLRVGVHSPFTQEALATRFAPLVRRTLTSVVGQPIEVRYEIAGADAPAGAPEPLFRQPEPRRPTGGQQRSAVVGRRSSVQDLPLPAPTRSPLNSRYTFATYVVGGGNRLAQAAAQAVADAPGQAYNPFFIYGGVGLGKTHLLHAIGNTVLGRGLQVLYVSSETFTNDMIDSIRDHRQDDFRQKYRRCNLLLIDDIQFIAGKVGTQEEFFHTFNAIHEGGGQIVLSSDRPPSEIPTLEARLRSRFEWGLIADIQLPDLETRIAILRSKLNGRAGSVPPEVLEFIAQKAQSNIRELEGSLNRVIAYGQLHRAVLTVELAADALQAVAPAQSGRAAPRAEDVLQAVCRYHGVNLADLRGKQRDRRVVVPRQMAMYLLREDGRLSTPEIGRLLGGRDHTTVMHGAQKIAGDLPNNPQLRGDLQAIRELIVGARH